MLVGPVRLYLNQSQHIHYIILKSILNVPLQKHVFNLKYCRLNTDNN